MADTLTLSQIEALLRSPEVAMYLHFGSSPQREVLGIAFADDLTPPSGQFAIDGHRVLIADKIPQGDDENVMNILALRDDPAGTRVFFQYPIEGVAGEMVVSESGEVSDPNVYEN